MRKNNFILFVLLGLLIFFLAIIKSYLISLVLAVIIAGLLWPIHKWILIRVKGRNTLACLLSLCVFFLVVLIPSLFLIGLVVEQAIVVTEQLSPLLQEQIEHSSDEAFSFPDWFPYAEQIEPYKQQIETKIGEFRWFFGKWPVFIYTRHGQFSSSAFYFVFCLILFSKKRRSHQAKSSGIPPTKACAIRRTS